MEVQERVDLHTRSNLNKKLMKIMENKEMFYELLEKETVKQLAENTNRGSVQDEKTDSSDMIVCIRVRPRLEHEVELGSLVTTRSSNPSVLVMDPSFDFKDRPKVSFKKFKVDLSFGPEELNEDIFRKVGAPLVQLALQGGVCSILSYGQTGSGKTFTINGMLQQISTEIFSYQNNIKGPIRLHLSYFELLGNNLTDLLNPQSEQKLEILEDKFGKVNVVGAKEIELESSAHLQQLIEQAAGHRKTSVTFKNDTSSRSHAVCKIRVENMFYKEAEDGCFFVIDLAGSENGSDSQFHDKERIKESTQINSSLMSLKECITNRARASENPQKHYHIPFRGSKLTLLLKEAFELESHKVCRTVVFANVSPTVVDNTMTLNTLRYVAPIKEGMRNKEKLVPDPNNPMNWSNQTLKVWVEDNSNGKVDPKVLCPWESGKQLLKLPEVEFIRRVIESNAAIGQKKAKVFYDKLWTVFIDARTEDRKKKVRQRFRLKKDEVYGKVVKVNEDETNKFQSCINNDLVFKGVCLSLIISTGQGVLGASKDLSMNLDKWRDVLTLVKDLSSLKEIIFSSKTFEIVGDSTDLLWKGIEKQDQKENRLILRIEKIQDKILINAAKASTGHSRLEVFTEPARNLVI